MLIAHRLIRAMVVGRRLSIDGLRRGRLGRGRLRHALRSGAEVGECAALLRHVAIAWAGEGFGARDLAILESAPEEVVVAALELPVQADTEFAVDPCLGLLLAEGQCADREQTD